MQTEVEILEVGWVGVSLVVGDEFPSCNNKTAASKMAVVAAAAAAAVVEAEQILRAGFYVRVFSVRRVGFQVAVFLFLLFLSLALFLFYTKEFQLFMLHYSVL